MWIKVLVYKGERYDIVDFSADVQLTRRIGKNYIGINIILNLK